MAEQTPLKVVAEQPSAKARGHIETVLRYCQDNMCVHCGRLPDADGDHSCPCLHSDADCPDHPTASDGEHAHG